MPSNLENGLGAARTRRSFGSPDRNRERRGNGEEKLENGDRGDEHADPDRRQMADARSREDREVGEYRKGQESGQGSVPGRCAGQEPPGEADGQKQEKRIIPDEQ